MTPKMSQSLLSLKQACEDLGYNFENIDNYSNSLVRVSDGKKKFFSSNLKVGLYPINPCFIPEIFVDKARTYSILEQNGYTLPKWNYFFLSAEYRNYRGDGKEIDDIIPYVNKYLSYPLFVKPNHGSMGKFAEIIESEEKLQDYIGKVTKKYDTIIIQEFIKLPEYRIFVIDGEIQFSYKKVDVNNLGKASISTGGEIHDYTEIHSKSTKKWIKKLSNDFEARLFGIDIFTKSSLENPDDFIIIEINSNPSLEGILCLGKQEKVMEIWKKILKKYFEKS